MCWRRDKGPWRMNGRLGATAMEVAAKLAKLEMLADLRYREIELEADAVDVTPCRNTPGRTYFRFFLLRAVHWPPFQLPQQRAVPTQWKSELISVPRQARAGLDAGLATFETEFATCTFLQRVEREIDGAPQRAEDQTAQQARRA